MRHLLLAASMLLGCDRAASAPVDAAPCPVCPVCPSAAAATSASSKPPAEGADEAPRTCSVRLKRPTASIVKVNNKVVEPKDEKLELTGLPGQMYFVAIEIAKRPVFIQQVYMTDDGCTPSDIDTERSVLALPKPK